MLTKKRKRLRSRNHAICRRENVRFIAKKSISNTDKEVRKRSVFSSTDQRFSSHDIALGARDIEHFVWRMIWYFRLDFSSDLIQTSRISFDETTTTTMIQMNAAKMLVQIVFETKSSKTTMTCMRIVLLDQNH